MEIPAEFTFKSVNKKLYDQVKEKVLKVLEMFGERRKDKQKLKKKKKKKRKTMKMCFDFCSHLFL